MSGKEKIRKLEILLLEKKLELLEVRVALFGMGWREKLDNMVKK